MLRVVGSARLGVEVELQVAHAAEEVAAALVLVVLAQLLDARVQEADRRREGIRRARRPTAERVVD